MKKEFTEIPLDGGQNPPKKFVLKYYSDPCPATGIEGRRGQLELLNAVTQNPQLLDVGFDTFKTMSMRHDQGCWILTLESHVFAS